MKKYLTLIGCLIIIGIFITLYLIESKTTNKKLEKITVAEVTHSVFYAPQYAAIANGYFEEVGLDIELILTSGADNVMASVLSGDVQIGLSGSEATIYVYNNNEKDYVKTFAQLTQKDGSFIISRKQNKNFTLNDLKGKTIIGGRTGGMPEMTLEWVLKQNNIDPKKDLNIDTSIAFAAMSGAFIGGQGDYVTLFEPLATKIVNEGYGYVVASLGELGGTLPYTAYNAKNSYIKNNPKIIDKFTKAIQKGLDYVNNSTKEQIAQTILEFFPDTSLNDLTDSVKRYKDNNTWPKDTTFKEESFNHLQEIIISAGQLDKNKTVNYKDLVYER